MGITVWLLIAANIFTVELFLLAGVAGRCRNLARTMTRAKRVLVRHGASDIWKERAVTALWFQMMRHTALLALTIVGVFLPLLLLYIADREWRLGAFDLFQSAFLQILLGGSLIAYALTRHHLGKA